MSRAGTKSARQRETLIRGQRFSLTLGLYMNLHYAFDHPELVSQCYTGPTLSELTRRSSLLFQVENHEIYFKIRRTLSSMNHFDLSGDWPTATITDKDDREICRLQVRPDPKFVVLLRNAESRKPFQALMLDLVQSCSHLTADTLDMIAHTFSQQQNKRKGNEFSSDSLLEYRGLLKHRGGKDEQTGKCYRGGFSKEARASISEQINLLANVFLVFADANLKVPGANGKKTMTQVRFREVPLLIFHEIRRDDVIHSSAPLQEWIIAPSEGFAKILDGGYAGLLPRKVLQYNHANEYLLKAIARYFHYLWRINHKQGVKDNVQYSRKIKVSEVLRNIDLDMDKSHPQRTLNRLQNGLDRLKKDCLIKSWKYGLARSEEELEHFLTSKRGWPEIWLTLDLIVEPSDKFISQLGQMFSSELYFKRKKASKEVEKNSPILNLVKTRASI